MYVYHIPAVLTLRLSWKTAPEKWWSGALAQKRQFRRVCKASVFVKTLASQRYPRDSWKTKPGTYLRYKSTWAIQNNDPT